MKYGIELEFFVSKNGKIIPAYEATDNLDGNPVIGELRTGVYKTIESCIFNLKKLIYIEDRFLAKKKCELVIVPEITVNNEFIRNLRRDSAFNNLKNNEFNEILSVYGEAKPHVLPIKVYKASLQINFSNSHEVYTKDSNGIYNADEKYYSSKLFNYVDLIKGLDDKFESEIKKTKRVKGIYSIKPAKYGQRIEYRSLPNDVDLYKVIESL